MDTRHVYICGAKGISQYGGFESFVQNLLKAHKDENGIRYHVTCKLNGDGSMDVSSLKGASIVDTDNFMYCNAECHLISVPDYIGSAQAIIYDVKSLIWICKHIEENEVKNPIVYVLACRIVPFIKRYVKLIHRAGGKVFVNPDGHEWKRRKWSKLVQHYWKLSERLMVKNADLIICDSIQIEKYIKSEYKKYNPLSTYISYGADTEPSKLADNDYRIIDWYEINNVKPHEYYLVVGRFVKENNFDIIIKEFMQSNADRKLVLLTTENESLKDQLSAELNYKSDKRIVFSDSIYDEELLKKIRENAYAYIHGHEVGGTNPSLLEAMASTKLNLVLDVPFNREVAGESALYWTKDKNKLKEIITLAESCSENIRNNKGMKAIEIIKEKYNWKKVSNAYKNQFSQYV